MTVSGLEWNEFLLSLERSLNKGKIHCDLVHDAVYDAYVDMLDAVARSQLSETAAYGFVFNQA